MNIKKIFVKHHLGLGDCIIHNGMVRKISEDYPDYEIYCASKTHNYKNISFMFKDNPKINVLDMDDNGVDEHLSQTNYDKIISSHFDSGAPYSYDEYGDDAFYLKVGIDPLIKTTHFYVERDYDKETDLYNKLTNEIGSEDYIFIHEKPEQNIIIDREKINLKLPIISAKPEYDFFDLLKIIENAKEVHIISSCFLSFFMVKKINPKTYAHMYCDRLYLSDMIRNNDIEVIL